MHTPIYITIFIYIHTITFFHWVILLICVCNLGSLGGFKQEHEMDYSEEYEKHVFSVSAVSSSQAWHKNMWKQLLAREKPGKLVSMPFLRIWSRKLFASFFFLLKFMFLWQMDRHLHAFNFSVYLSTYKYIHIKEKHLRIQLRQVCVCVCVCVFVCVCVCVCVFVFLCVYI